MIHHVTYEVPVALLDRPGEIDRFMDLLGFRVVVAGERAEWPVRWYRSGISLLHLVGREEVPLGLGHFCAVVDNGVYEALKTTQWCTRNSGSGRIWLEAYGLRVEVRPYDD